MLFAMVWVAFAETMTVYETIIYESSGESLEGQVAVAKVIRNRAKDRRLSFDEVCLQPYQFSCWNTPPTRKYTQKELDTAKEAWKMSQNSHLRANLYCRVDCYPKWIYHPSVSYIKTIGNHKFYKERR